jgi:hypothetical protein
VIVADDITPEASLRERPVFGDPDWIARRGPVKPPRHRIRPRKSKDSKPQGCELWFLIDGRAVRLRCSKCRPGNERSAHRWRILGRDGSFADVVCEAGHRTQCFAGYYLERPGGVDEDG